VGVRRFHNGYPEARQVVTCISPEGFHETQWSVTCTTCPATEWPMESSLIFQSGNRCMSAYFYVFVFPSLCVGLAKDQWPGVKLNFYKQYWQFQRQETLRRTGLKRPVFRQILCDRMYITNWMAGVCFLGSYWFCLSWHQHHVSNSIYFLFSGYMPLFLRDNATLKDTRNIEIYNWWLYFYDHLGFPDFEF